MPIRGVKARLEKAGVASQFDFRGVTVATVPPEEYLTAITEGFMIVGLDKPETTLHDVIFHGLGFLSVDKNVGDLMKLAARRALLSKNKQVMSKCIDAIDGVTGAFLGSKIEPDIDLKRDIEIQVRELAQVLGTGIPGDDMRESIKAQNDARLIAEQAPKYAIDCASHFESMLSQLK